MADGVAANAIVTMLGVVAFRSWIFRCRSATPTPGVLHVTEPARTASETASTNVGEEAP